MKTNKSEILKALAQPCSIASEKLPIPIMSHVLLSSSGGNLKIRSSGISHSSESQCKSNGDLLPVCIKADKLFAVIGKCRKDDVEINLDGNELQIESGNLFRLPTIKSDEFPSRPVQGTACEASCKILGNSISTVSWASASNTLRQALCSVHIVLKNGKLLVESVNGRDGAFIECNMPGLVFDAVIPIECCQLLSDSLKLPGAKFYVSEKNLFVSHELGFYSCQTMAQAFPDLEPLRKFNREKIADINRDEWLFCFNTISTIMTDVMASQDKFIRAVCEIENDCATISSKANQVSKFSDKIFGSFSKKTTLQISAIAFEKCLNSFTSGDTIEMSICENSAISLKNKNLLVVTGQLR